MRAAAVEVLLKLLRARCCVEATTVRLRGGGLAFVLLTGCAAVQRLTVDLLRALQVRNRLTAWPKGDWQPDLSPGPTPCCAAT